MSMLFVMIPLAIVLLAAAIAAFFWAVRTGQFDDLEQHGTLVLFDDEPLGTPSRPAPGAGTRPGDGAVRARAAQSAGALAAGSGASR